MTNFENQLVLVPTEFERKRIEAFLAKRSSSSHSNLEIHLCGFGPIASAASTMKLLHELRPSRVTLIGIAGTYFQETGTHPVGSATRFDQVLCDGVGVGSSENFVSASSLGWAQWAGDDQIDLIEDCIACSPAVSSDSKTSIDLLTVCAGASDALQANRRVAQYPTAVGEDMEGFGVAMSCQMMGIPLDIIRGFSNFAGDRNKTNWRTDDALQSAIELLLGE